MEMQLNDWIAVYGAVLATLLAIKEIIVLLRDRRKEKRQVKVDCNFTMTLITTDNARQLTRVIVITAVNSGFQPVTIEDAGFKLADGHKSFPLGRLYQSWPLPKTLDDGEPVEIYFDYGKIGELAGEGHTFTLAYVRDAEGTEYTTSRLPADMPGTRSPGFLKRLFSGFGLGV